MLTLSTFDPVSAALAILILAASLDGSQQKRSDARDDGLLGPVRSISTRQETQQVDWGQKDAKIDVLVITCWDCEFDSEGNRITNGQTVNGEFRGLVVRISRDESGKVTERVEENYDSETVSRVLLGPHGITERVDYQNGKPHWRSTWSYDANGHQSEFRHYDENGELFESSAETSDASGNNKDQWDYGRNGSFSLHFMDTYDPKTDLWRFTNFNEDGSAKVTIVTQNSKLLSYWQQQTAEEKVFGSGFFLDRVGKEKQSFSCHPDGSCDRMTSYFPDETSPHVSRVEWRDSAGVLRLSFDYEYQLDRFGNWTKRTVKVWSPELGEPKLCETDYRTLTYWAP
jgi:hypothetical protein